MHVGCLCLDKIDISSIMFIYSLHLSMDCVNRIAPELMTVANNGNATAYWNVENGYMNNVNQSNTVYPHRVFGCGLRDSLLIILGITLDDSHHICSDLAEGFHLALHSPDKLPNLPEEFIHIPVEQDIYISIKPQMITTSNALRKYTPTERGCYFKTERQLRFFRTYNQQNCERECYANFTKAQCGCNRFSLPSKRNCEITLKN